MTWACTKRLDLRMCTNTAEKQCVTVKSAVSPQTMTDWDGRDWRLRRWRSCY